MLDAMNAELKMLEPSALISSHAKWCWIRVSNLQMVQKVPHNREWRPLIDVIRTHFRNDALNLHEISRLIPG